MFSGYLASEYHSFPPIPVDATSDSKKKRPTSTDIVALTNVPSSPAAHLKRKRERKLSELIERSRKQHGLAKRAPMPKPRKRRRSKRLQGLACQQIVSDDEFGTYDTLPFGSESLSPDPLPEEDVPKAPAPPVFNVDDEEDDENDVDLELKLRLEALRSKQEIKNDFKTPPLDSVQMPKLESPLPPGANAEDKETVDEEHELRLIALKSAVLKKHQRRKARREETRPYSPTDDALENFDVPSPPLSVQNMDISPLGTPSPLSENNNAVDMDLADNDSQSPIFFSCSVVNGVSPKDGETTEDVAPEIDRVEIEMSRSAHDDDDPDQLRAFLLKKIEEAALRRSMHVTKVIEEKPAEEPEKSNGDSCVGEDEDPDDEHVLRASLLSKAKRLKAAPNGVVASDLIHSRPLSEILSDQSKKVMDLKTISRTIENDPVNVAIPKSAKASRNALISEMRPIKVAPVIIALGADSSSESSMEDDDSQVADDLGDDDCNQSPLSINMDSPTPNEAHNPSSTDGLKENFDSKLSEFLKKARQSTKPDPSDVLHGVSQLPIRKIVTNKKIVKKVVSLRKTVGLESAIQLGANAVEAFELSIPLRINASVFISRL